MSSAVVVVPLTPIGVPLWHRIFLVGSWRSPLPWAVQSLLCGPGCRTDIYFVACALLLLYMVVGWVYSREDGFPAATAPLRSFLFSVILGSSRCCARRALAWWLIMWLGVADFAVRHRCPRRYVCCRWRVARVLRLPSSFWLSSLAWVAYACPKLRL